MHAYTTVCDEEKGNPFALLTRNKKRHRCVPIFISSIVTLLLCKKTDINQMKLFFLYVSFEDLDVANYL